jgi:Flp pilus assembly protein TadD
MGKIEVSEFREDFPMLIEAGFVAVKQLDEVGARHIFQAAQLINPDSTAPQIGLGYIALNKLDVKTASQLFEQVLDKEPENHLAHTFLAICMLLNKEQRVAGEKLIQEIIAKTDDPTVKTLGALSLEWAEKDLKKLKSPFFEVKGESALPSKIEKQ